MPLSFEFRNKTIPVTHPQLSEELAQKALESSVFRNWVHNCEHAQQGNNTNNYNDNNKQLDVQAVEIQSVDLFGARGVGFVKIKSHCTLNTESQQQTITHHALPGICFLRGHAVTILVALICAETNTTYSLLVDQPRVPIGQASVLELPAGMLDDDTQTIHGTAVKELQEECGISIQPKDLVNLTQLIHAPQHGLALSAGGCDEQCQFLYLEKMVTQKQLEAMKGRLTGLREHGEVITLRVVPIEDVWRVSMDVKAMVALFLLEQLRKQGTLPAEGQLATPLEDVVLEE